MFYFVLAFVAFACLLPKGFSLKCYSCVDTEGTDKTPSCKSPKNLWNVTDCSVASQGFDSCLVHRTSTIKNGVKVTYGNRGCNTAAKCAHYWLSCQEMKKRFPDRECVVRCCKDNLCNEGEPDPPKYEFFKPSGKDLSCYTCSDFPRETRLASGSMVPVPRNCTHPVKQMCGRFSLINSVKQDRCITLKVKAIMPSAGNKVLDWTYRGCSSIYHCSFTEALWGYELNKASKEDRTGIRYLSGKSSCCHGNLCNSTTDSVETDDSSGDDKISKKNRTRTSYQSGKSSCCYGNQCNSTTDSHNSDDCRSERVATDNVQRLSAGIVGFICFFVTAMINPYIG